jgi:hypothetical protein
LYNFCTTYTPGSQKYCKKLKTNSAERENRNQFEENCAGKFSGSNFLGHCPLVIPEKAVSRKRTESVSEESKNNTQGNILSIKKGGGGNFE